LERRSHRFTATGDRRAGNMTCDNPGKKIETAEEQAQLFEVSESKERIEDAPAFDNDKEVTPEFEWQFGDFFDSTNDEVLEVSSASWLVPFLLLGLRERDSYGHELMRSMSGFDFGPRRPVAVYRALQQMEKEGMVVSERDGSHGRLSRRKYSIAEPGEVYLEFWANSLLRYREEVDFFLRLYSQLPAL
jgi:PadR family transcriptional regulator PadR